jgi:hypothetical protein
MQHTCNGKNQNNRSVVIKINQLNKSASWTDRSLYILLLILFIYLQMGFYTRWQ